MKIVGGRVVNEGAVVSCSQGGAVAEAISKELGIPHIPGELKRYSLGELKPWPSESVSAYDVLFLVQTFPADTNDRLMEMYFMMSSLHRAHGPKIYVAIPSFPYSRQDTIAAPREPVSAREVANMLELAGMYSLITIMLHSRQEVGFFSGPCDNLSMRGEIVNFVRQRFYQPELIWVGPDEGSGRETKKIAGDLEISHLILPKIKDSSTGQIHRPETPVDIAGRPYAIGDDMVDGGKTIGTAVKFLDSRGGKNSKRYLAVTHPILSGDAIAIINDCVFSEIVFSDSIPIPAEKMERFNVKPHILSVNHVLSLAVGCRLRREPLPDFHKFEYGS